jgi:hypothetical protein
MLILTAWLSGCAARADLSESPATQIDALGAQIDAPAAMVAIQPAEISAPAAALVFSPPITLNQPPLDLSRDRRAPAAWAGFEERVTTFLYVRIDDYQTQHHRERYDRRATSERTGVSYR